MSDDSGSGGHNVTSINQHGGITAGELNLESRPRRLTSQHKETLRQNIGKHDDIEVTCVLGDGEAHQFAEQIKKFLKKDGYKSVEGIHQVVKTQAVEGQVVYRRDDRDDVNYEIHIGSKR